jgi:twitching motility protein PilU
LHIDDLLRQMSDLGASDLYVREASPPMARVSGKTEATCPAALTAEQMKQLADQVLSPREQEMFERDRQVDLSYTVENLGRFRANVYLQRGSIGMVFRRINSIVPDLDSLGLPEVLKSLALERRGLLLVTGATGSGKSTTLAAMIDYRNAKTTGHILTIEDPIEFIHKDRRCIISQREVGLDVPDFQAGLRAGLRQAPDVLLIGEMRDVETASAALQFAETGHLVLGTLHSTNASQTIERVLQFFPAERHDEICSLMALNLRGIISQRLVPRCSGGRVPALEILLGTPRVRELLKKCSIEDLKSTMTAGATDGMQTFDQSLYGLLQAGEISEEDALLSADSANDLKLRMRGFSVVSV